MAKTANVIWYRQLKWGDLIVYLLVAAASLTMLFTAPSRIFGGSSAQAEEPLHASIHVDGTLIWEAGQETLVNGGRYEFESRGYHYVVTYADGRIRIDEADCPDQVCVLTGWLGRNGQITACVPGHVLMKIEGRLQNTDGSGISPDLTDEPDIILR